jgi:23S rRNA (cytidine1920-2'-O)/16S rRNA (cytidine1409-2'-O)-methyltransferase
VDKPGTLCDPKAKITLREAALPFVSRGGLKLEGALERFGLGVHGRLCADVGASTGGFTDCLLQRGAARVLAIDVGYGQFAWKLRGDRRVILLERTNVRHLEPEDLPFRPNLVVVDVSFISLRLVLPCVVRLLASVGDVVALVKPQFEVGRGRVGKGGVVRDAALQDEAVDGVIEAAAASGLRFADRCESPLRGPSGNREFFVLFRWEDGEAELADRQSSA